MPRKTTGLVIILFSVIVANQAGAYSAVVARDFWDKSGYFGGNIGFIGTGKIRIDGDRANTQPGFTFGAKFDFRLFDRVYWGVSADVHRLYVRDTGQYFLDLCFNIKRLYFSRSSRVGFRPGVGIGFGHLTHFRDIESSTYLMTRVTLEVIFFSETRVGWLIETGLLAAPVGGNREKNITYGPVPLFRIGAMF